MLGMPRRNRKAIKCKGLGNGIIFISVQAVLYGVHLDYGEK